ncbi:TPM domain-containing protein [Flavobacterium sp.]|uniref:TPM domain-containing protein n=1 Tax=Flavobacterium sp. TaxID=239 RepID=UPI0026026D39|nr:TPM domain-containing protein [Flavobacterium sp.]
MLRKIMILTVLLSIFFITNGQPSADNFWNNLPKPVGWVNDFEDILTNEEEKTLDSLIVDYEKKTTTEISIVTIPASATSKEGFDALTLRLANAWNFGKTEKANGILIAISKGFKIIRIQNGNGITEQISDYQTKQIIDQIFIPSLKAEAYFRALFDGIQEIKRLLDSSLDNYFVDFNEITVYQFIELLKVDNQNLKQINFLSVGMEAPENWVTGKEIDDLMPLIRSTEPAKCVVQSISSYLPIGDSSTIGGQVMDIVEAFKNKISYPTALTSCAKTDPERINKLTTWWNQHKK